jgi:hypothetical protein
MVIIKLIFLLFIIWLIFFYNYIDDHDNCLIDFNLYPELNILIENNHIIINELNNIITSNKWILYDDLHHKSLFKNNTINDIFKTLKSKETTLNSSDKPTWKLYGLLFNRQIYNNDCPNTIKMLLNIPSVINAGFSCLEPGKYTDYHTDNNDNFFRVQIPLVIPDGNCKFKIKNKILDWKKPFIFNDNCFHQAWNLTQYNRFVLILDIQRI